MNCPTCKSELESVSGDYGTGVYAPDGYQEHHWQEGYYCERCNYVFDVDDIEQERMDEQVCDEIDAVLAER